MQGSIVYFGYPIEEPMKTRYDNIYLIYIGLLDVNNVLLLIP